MTTADEGDTVRVHYTGRTDEDGVFDSSEDREPLEFTLGQEQAIDGFDEAIQGMEVGDEKTVTIPPEKAYGERQPGHEMEIPRDQFPPDLEPERGQVLEVTDREGRRQAVEVVGVDRETVTVDQNHPLAGKELTFDIELVDVVQD